METAWQRGVAGAVATIQGWAAGPRSLLMFLQLRPPSTDGGGGPLRGGAQPGKGCFPATFRDPRRIFSKCHSAWEIIT